MLANFQVNILLREQKYKVEWEESGSLLVQSAHWSVSPTLAHLWIAVPEASCPLSIPEAHWDFHHQASDIQLHLILSHPFSCLISSSINSSQWVNPSHEAGCTGSFSFKCSSAMPRTGLLQNGPELGSSLQSMTSQSSLQISYQKARTSYGGSSPINKVESCTIFPENPCGKELWP